MQIKYRRPPISEFQPTTVSRTICGKYKRARRGYYIPAGLYKLLYIYISLFFLYRPMRRPHTRWIFSIRTSRFNFSYIPPSPQYPPSRSINRASICKAVTRSWGDSVPRFSQPTTTSRKSPLPRRVSLFLSTSFSISICIYLSNSLATKVETRTIFHPG